MVAEKYRPINQKYSIHYVASKFFHFVVFMYDTNFVDKIVNHVIGKKVNGSLILGIAGAQGSGKSTLSLQTKSRIEDSGIPCVVVCLDDFYYTKATRLELSRSVHSLLSTRGPPGTHDIGKLMDVLDRIRQNTETVTWSTFNKATDDQDPSRMITFTPTPNRATVIILEGWCVGCLPTYTEPAVNELEVVEDPSAIWRHYVNEQIKTKYIPLWNMIDIYMYIALPTTAVDLQQGIFARSQPVHSVL